MSTCTLAMRLRVVSEIRKTIDGMRDFPVSPADDDVARLRGLASILRSEAARCEAIALSMEELAQCEEPNP